MLSVFTNDYAGEISFNFFSTFLLQCCQLRIDLTLFRLGVSTELLRFPIYVRIDILNDSKVISKYFKNSNSV